MNPDNPTTGEKDSVAFGPKGLTGVNPTTTGEWTLVPRALHFNIMCGDTVIYEGVTSKMRGQALVDAHNAAIAAELEKRKAAETEWWAMVQRQRLQLAATVEALEIAWGVIANAGGGDWQKESKEWQDAATKWRDNHFHAALQKIGERYGTATSEGGVTFSIAP